MHLSNAAHQRVNKDWFDYPNTSHNNLLAFDVEGNAQSNQPNPQWDYSPPADYAGIRWWEDSYKSTYSRQVGGSCSIKKRGVSKKSKRLLPLPE